jgi:hypothetical protein
MSAIACAKSVRVCLWSLKLDAVVWNERSCTAFPSELDKAMRLQITEPELLKFIQRLRDTRLSEQSIVSALNRSPWARQDGSRWRVSEIGAICTASLNDLAPDTVDSGRCCRFHRRLALLDALRGWSPFDVHAANLAVSYVRAGESIRRVAGRLNRADVPAPNGRKWTPRLVQVTVYLAGPSLADHDVTPDRLAA